MDLERAKRLISELQRELRRVGRLDENADILLSRQETRDEYDQPHRVVLLRAEESGAYYALGAWRRVSGKPKYTFDGEHRIFDVQTARKAIELYLSEQVVVPIAEGETET
jgi:hypothetical protein